MSTALALWRAPAPSTGGWEHRGAIALAYVVLSERLGTLPDGGDSLYAVLFSPDECQALEGVLELAKVALIA